MKTHFWLIAFFCFSFFHASSQRTGTQYPYRLSPPKAGDDEVLKEVFVNTSLAYNYFYRFQTGGDLEVSFPYTTYNSKQTTSGVFSSTAVNPFTAPVGQLELNLREGSRRHFADINGGLSDSHNYWWALGCGHTLFQFREFRKTVYVKGSLSVARYTFQTALGPIPAPGMVTNAMNKTLDSTFHAATKYSNTTEVVDHVNVAYVEKTWSLQPKLSLEWHPFKNKFFMEFTVAYVWSFSEQGSIWLSRVSVNRTDSEYRFKLNSSGLTTEYDGVTLQSSPFTIRAFQFGVHAGLSFHEFRLKKRTHR